MGSTVMDVAREFQMRLPKFGEMIAVAFVEYVPRHNQLRLTILIDRENPDEESNLVQLEMDVEEAFPEISMDFSTIHLRGRDPDEFIPEDAFVVLKRSAHARAIAR